MNRGWAHFGQLEYSADEPGEVLLLPALEENGANPLCKEYVAIDDIRSLVEADLGSVLEVEVHLVAVSTNPRGLDEASLVNPFLDEDSVKLIRLLDNVAVKVESVDCTRLLLTHGVSLVELDCIVWELVNGLFHQLHHRVHEIQEQLGECTNMIL